MYTVISRGNLLENNYYEGRYVFDIFKDKLLICTRVINILFAQEIKFKIKCIDNIIRFYRLKNSRYVKIDEIKVDTE